MSVGWEGLELQLRALPGVVAAGFSVDSDRVAVQLLLEIQANESELRRLVADLTVPVADRPVSVEVAWLEEAGGRRLRPKHGPRVRLAGVWTEAMTGAVKIELARGERLGDGFSVDAGARASAEATLAALSELGADVSFLPETATGSLATSGSHLVEVALEDHEGIRRYGIAHADSIEVAAARATLHALNRHLSGQPSLASPVEWTPSRPATAPPPPPAGTPVTTSDSRTDERVARPSASFGRWYAQLISDATRWRGSPNPSGGPVPDQPNFATITDRLARATARLGFRWP